MLYVIDTGHSAPNTQLLDPEGVDEIIEGLKGFEADCTIVPDAYMCADNRSFQSRRNHVFTTKVDEALQLGRDIILLTPDTAMLDIRLRKKAAILALPRTKDITEVDGLKSFSFMRDACPGGPK